MTVSKSNGNINIFTNCCVLLHSRNITTSIDISLTFRAKPKVRFHFVSNADSLDWKELGTSQEINKVLNHEHLGNGSIILFHNDAKYTPDALEDIIKGLKDKGYEIVPISKLIHKENYYMNHEGRQIPQTSEETTA